MRGASFLWLGVLISILALTGRSSSQAVNDLSASGIEFVDVARLVGVDFHHQNGASGRKYLPETMGAGAAFLDYDGDQDLDIYLVNGAALPGYEAVHEPADALYRNDGGVTFAEVSARAGINDDNYGMGCAAADYDNDGDLDLYLTHFGPNVLYRNEGNGSFIEVTERAAVGDTNWSTSCAFLDYDNDGDLDLYVVNYVHYALEHRADGLKPYLAASQNYSGIDIDAYPHPQNFPAAADILYRNEGNGRFSDVTAFAGLVDTAGVEGRGLGVVAGDCDGDGLVDIYVANDTDRNFFYRNEGDGTLSEIGSISGVAYGQDGQRYAGMGVDIGDYNNDGSVDLVVANFQNEPVSLYQNRGNVSFANTTFASGVGLATLRSLSFGVGFLDYDSDGYQDLFVANGHVQDNVALVDPSTSYEQQDLLLRNEGPDQWQHCRFKDVSSEVGFAALPARVSRGCAFGDYDDDGDVDILIANCGQQARLLRNDGGNANNWLTIKTVGTRSNRDGIGARIALRSGSLSQVKEVKGSYSYLSQNDLRVNFGLGTHTRVDELEIRWPSGQVERLQNIGVNRFLTLVEGKGIAEERNPGNHSNRR